MKNKKITVLLIGVMVFAVAFFSACTFEFYPGEIVPKIYIDTDYKMGYNEDEEFYTISLFAGETYSIKSDLGAYDEDEYFIEFEKQTDSSVLEVRGSDLIASNEVSEETVVIVFAVLKKQGEEKAISHEEIRVSILIQNVE